jgi:hypothetical protein
MEVARQELAVGLVLVVVTVDGDDAMHGVADILRNHGSHRIFHTGHWTITTLS